MGYYSRYDTKVTTYMCRKYDKNTRAFKEFDDYLMFLFYDVAMGNDKRYYELLEDDMREFGNWQIKKCKEIDAYNNSRRQRKKEENSSKKQS